MLLVAELQYHEAETPLLIKDYSHQQPHHPIKPHHSDRRSRRTPRRQPWRVLISGRSAPRQALGLRPRPFGTVPAGRSAPGPAGVDKGAEAGLATLGRRLKKAAMARKNTLSPSLSQRATVSPNQVQPSRPLLSTVFLSHAHPSLLRRRARPPCGAGLDRPSFRAKRPNGKERDRPRCSARFSLPAWLPVSPSCRCVGGHRRRPSVASSTTASVAPNAQGKRYDRHPRACPRPRDIGPRDLTRAACRYLRRGAIR